jgi:hypothetical protein
MVVTLPSSTPGWFGSFDTWRTYDLRGERFFLKVPKVPNPATAAVAFLSLNQGNNDAVTFRAKAGQLHCVATIGGNDFDLGTLPYDPVQHLYWAIRDDGLGTLFWETSPNGVSFTVRAQKPTAQLAPISAVDVQFGAYDNSSDASPGGAAFDDLNGGGPASEKWCPSSSFTDDFNDGVRAPKWGNAYADPEVGMSESNGTLNFAMASSMTGFGSYLSNVSFDMTGDAVLVQIPAGPNVATTAQIYLRASTDSNNGVVIDFEKGTVYFQKEIAGNTTDVGSTAVSASTAWIRIRESGGMTFWESSADGKTWTVHGQAANVIDMTRVDIQIGGGMYENVLNPGTSKFDNYNLPP